MRTPMATALAETATRPPGYSAIPLTGLAAREPLPFPLYLRTAENSWVLYRPATSALDDAHLGRLQAEGIAQLFIRECDRGLYFQRVEGALDEILLQRGVPLERRADVLQGVATAMAEELLAAPPTKVSLQRAQKVMVATSGLMLREANGFAALRKLMKASPGLARHSLTTGFLCMGLARVALAADATALTIAGLAGLLHDIGKVGQESRGTDPEHALRGADQLKAFGLPTAVVEAARSHHERWDGSGFPHGLAGTEIPELARVVGLVNTFDKVYTAQQPRVGVFDALRILAQAYRGCFEPRLTSALVSLFR